MRAGMHAQRQDALFEAMHHHIQQGKASQHTVYSGAPTDVLPLGLSVGSKSKGGLPKSLCFQYSSPTLSPAFLGDCICLM